MKFVSILAGMCLCLAGADAAMADVRYDIAAIDDVNGDPTFSGSMTTTAPFSLSYNFSVVDFSLHYLAKNVTYTTSNTNIVIEAQGFLFNARDASSSFELTFYPDGSYFSEYVAPGQAAFDDSGYFAFSEVPAVPEPASIAMLLAGLGVFGIMARRQRQA